MSLSYLVTHVATALAAVASFVMVLGLMRGQRTPQSTLAWLLGLVFVPFVTIPLYFLLGARKFPRRAKRPVRLPAAVDDLHDAPPLARVLRGSGVAAPSSGNRFELIGTGELAYERLLEMIGEARESIYLTTFILGWDEAGRTIVDALARRAASGVEVRVILDAVGCLKSRGPATRILERAGAQVRVFMPLSHAPWRGRNNLRSHRKLAVFDRARLLTGGMNLALEYMGPRDLPTPEPRWRDVAAVCEGPVVAAALALFESDFEYSGGKPRVLSRATPGEAGTAVAQLVPSGPDFATDTIYDLFLAAIHGAQRRLELLTPYYVPDDALQHALVLAARRGVSTEIVVPAISNHLLADVARRGLLRELVEAGVVVRYYDKGMVHAKAMAVDEAFAYVGSPNFDMRSLFLNYENALCLYSAPEVNQVRGYIAALSAECGSEPKVRPASPVLEQLVAVRLLRHAATIVPARRAELRHRRDTLVEALRSLLPEWSFTVPPGGTMLWAELDGPVSSALARAAEDVGVRLAPGPRFGLDGTLERFLRLPFTLPPDELIEAVRRIAEVHHDLDRAARPSWRTPAVIA